jgi:DNA-directed RNA polymerase specialized sigma24 family protein
MVPAMRHRLYSELRARARLHLRDAAAAEDVVQDALLAAIAAGRTNFDDPANSRWLQGVVRNQARLHLRTAGRRRQREAGWAALRPPEREPDDASGVPVLSSLPPALKVVAALALCGHSRHEIAWLLSLSDAALRQRITALKRQLQALGASLPADGSGLTLDLPYGRIREALLPKLLREGGQFATHDPDGHLFVIRRSQTANRRQQTVQLKTGARP